MKKAADKNIFRMLPYIRTAYWVILSKFFTLIELLLVVAVITILAGLFLPALKTAKEKGSQIQCMDNLKQMGIGMMFYINDNNSYLPNLYDNSAWYDKINFYLNNQRIFLCPSFSNATYGTALSYGYNGIGLGTIATTLTSKAPFYMRIENIKKPSDIVAVADSSKAGVAWGGYFISWGLLSSFHVAETRHGCGCNFLFVDGHIKWYKYGSEVIIYSTYWKPY